VSSDGKTTHQWRRRESNPRTDPSNQCNGLQLQLGDSAGAAPEHRAAATRGHHLTSNGSLAAVLPPSVRRIAGGWSGLPPHMREAILTLLDSGLLSAQAQRWSVTASSSTRGGFDFHKIAWSIARDCRRIVQACLREEEWQAADEEFYRLIFERLF
jgi:hypothetical protein